MSLLALYAGCLVLGGLLIGFSFLGAGKDVEAGPVDASGGHDLSHDHDLAHDHDLGHGHEFAHDHAGLAKDVGGAFAATLLSTRFWTFGLASFGLTGVVLALLGQPAWVSAPVAAVAGGVTGTAVSTLFRRLSRETVSTSMNTREFQGREAEVMLAIAPDRPGKVRLQHAGLTVEVIATTREGRRIERGERVLIVDMNAGRADVTPTSPGPSSPPSALTT